MKIAEDKGTQVRDLFFILLDIFIFLNPTVNGRLQRIADSAPAEQCLGETNTVVVWVIESKVHVPADLSGFLGGVCLIDRPLSFTPPGDINACQNMKRNHCISGDVIHS